MCRDKLGDDIKLSVARGGKCEKRTVLVKSYF